MIDLEAALDKMDTELREINTNGDVCLNFYILKSLAMIVNALNF